MERKWHQTPLAMVFSVDNEWILLKQRAQVPHASWCCQCALLLVENAAWSLYLTQRVSFYCFEMI
jgi:hypothetical protein